MAREWGDGSNKRSCFEGAVLQGGTEVIYVK